MVVKSGGTTTAVYEMTKRFTKLTKQSKEQEVNKVKNTINSNQNFKKNESNSNGFLYFFFYSHVAEFSAKQ